jgi:hypothetical protein
VEIFGVNVVGMSLESGRKVLLTLVLVALVFLLRHGLRALMRLVLAGQQHTRVRFWMHQGISLTVMMPLILGVLSLWFDDQARLTTVLGLFSAGLAFALQKVITASIS